MNRRTNTVGRLFGTGVLAVVLGLTAVPYASAAINPSNNGNHTLAPSDTKQYESWLKEKVRHELVMLPYLSVFDNLQYRVDGSTVTLEGQVRNSRAEARRGKNREAHRRRDQGGEQHRGAAAFTDG